ncbi:hypothetical protein TB2_034390 [Malus domestica]
MGGGVGSRGDPAKFGTGVGSGCWWVGAAVLLGVVVRALNLEQILRETHAHPHIQGIVMCTGPRKRDPAFPAAPKVKINVYATHAPGQLALIIVGESRRLCNQLQDHAQTYIMDLYPQFSRAHEGSAATRFEYNRRFSVTLYLSDTLLVLHEKKDGTLFVLANYPTEDIGYAVMVTCVQCTFLEGFYYDLVAKCNGNSLILESFTKSIPRQQASLPHGDYEVKITRPSVETNSSLVQTLNVAPTTASHQRLQLQLSA